MAKSKKRTKSQARAKMLAKKRRSERLRVEYEKKQKEAQAKARTSLTNRKNRKTNLIIGKRGDRTANYDKLISKINRNKSLTDSQKITMSNMIQDLVDEMIEEGQKAVTEKELLAKLEDNKFDRMLINMGIDDIRELSSISGISENLLADKSNWDGSTFTNPMTGKSFKLEFSYYGNPMIEVI